MKLKLNRSLTDKRERLSFSPYQLSRQLVDPSHPRFVIGVELPFLWLISNSSELQR